MRIIASLLSALALALPAQALADDVEVRGSCGKGATSKLRLRSDHGSIRVEFELRHGGGREAWRVTIVHERRVAWRGRARTRSGSLRVRRSLPDFDGADQVAVRVAGPRGRSCTATGLLTAS